MLQASRSRTSKFIFYGAAALMILSMAGFGLNGALRGTNTGRVASVGGLPVTDQAYFRAIQNDIRDLSQQLGQAITIDQMIASGRTQQVLGQLIRDAALDAEAERLVLSISDAALRDALTANPAFAGADGKFDADMYRLAMEQSRLKPSEYESLLRKEATRNLIRGAVTAGSDMPEAPARAILDYIGEERNISYVRVGAGDLPDPVVAPSDAEIRAYYDAHPEEFTTPLTRTITYVSLLPEDIAASIDVPESAVVALYESRAEQYDVPSRRFLDRIAFGTMTEAEAARTELDAGSTTFEAIAEARKLTPQDIDLGEVEPGDLPRAAREAIFGSEDLGVYGPFQTDLGPVLYRVNAVLDEQLTPLEEVRDELTAELALDLAADVVIEQFSVVDDLLLGGATLEEVAAETDLTLSTRALAEGETDGIAAYQEFREAAATTDTGRPSDVTALPDGGIFALRVEGITEATLQPLESVRDKAEARALAEKTQAAIADRAETLRQAYSGTSDLAPLADFNMLTLETASGITRGASVPDLPESVVATIFEMQPGETRSLDSTDGALILRLDEIVSLDYSDEGNQSVLDQILENQDQQLANDIVAYFSAALVNAEEITVNQPRVDQLHDQLR